MSAIQQLKYASFAILIVCALVLGLMWRRRALFVFPSLTLFLCAQLLEEIVSIPLLFFRKATGLSLRPAYAIYFYSHWFFFIVESLLLIGILYSIFHLAMEPLKGLHDLGKVVFHWIAIVSGAFTLCVVVGPYLLLNGRVADAFVVQTASHIQQGVNVLTLCLMLFVCFAIKPLGLTFRSRIFGVSLGLGIYAMVGLIESAVDAFTPNQSMYSPVYFFTAIGTLVVYSVWGVYFFLPEPARGMVLLPTTSPYFFWNKISEILGDEPGHVVVAGFTPQMMAPAELTVANEMSRSAARRALNPRASEPRELRDERAVANGFRSASFLDQYDSLTAS